MTRIIRQYLTICLLFATVFPLTAFATPTRANLHSNYDLDLTSLMALNLNIEDVSGNVGEEVCLTVTPQNFTDILGMQFSIGYDSDVLEFSTITNFNSRLRIDEEFLTDNFGLPGTGNVPLGSITFVWDAPGARAVSIDDNDPLFDLCFTIKTTAETTVQFAGTPTAIQIIDINEATVDLVSEPGTVNEGGGGNNGGGGDPTNFDEFTLDVGDGAGGVGDEVCLQVDAYKLIGILGMQFSIGYDPDLLEYKSLKQFNSSLRIDEEFLTDNFGLPGTGNVPEGRITFVWDAPGARAITIDDGELLFELCFTVKGTSETTVDFADNPTGIQIIDENEQTVDFNSDAGTINGGAAPQLNANFTANRTNIKVGESINFTDNSAGNPTSWSWRFQRGTPRTSTAQNPSGITYDEAGTFRVILEVSNADGSDTETKEGYITVTEDGFNTFTADITDALGDVNDEVCLSVDAYKFPPILGIQFTIDYDPDILEFTELTTINSKFRIDEEFLTDNFGLPGTGVLPLGKITMVWDAPGARSVTFGDGEKLFDICFRIKSTDRTIVEFTSDPTAIQVIDENEDLVDFNSDPGTVNGAQPPDISAQANITDVECKGESTGAIDISVQSGGGSLSYAWSYQNQTTEDLTGLPSGSYTVTVTDNESSLFSTATFVVSEPATGINLDAVNVTDVACFGQSNGAINISASGGTGNLSYSWNAGLPGNANPGNLSARSDYSVTITDASGCDLASGPIAVSEPDQIVIQPNIIDIACFGADNGQINLSITGGTPDYSYSWSSGLPAQMNQSGLGVGSYEVTITDANGCTASSSDLSIAQTGQLQISSMNITRINTGNDGRITIAITGGSGSYSYSWEGPENFSSNQQNLTGLSVPGEYCLVASDDNDCELNECFQVVEKVKINLAASEITTACFGQATGGVRVALTGGIADYSYNWSTGATGAELAGVEAGTYVVTITDGSGDQTTGSFEVPEFDKIDLVAEVTNVSENVNNTNGSVNLTVSGGQQPYQIRWDDGSTGMSVSNLPIGDFCVTVTDGRQCESVICAPISFDAQPLALAAETTSTRCNGASDGRITINITGGWGPFTATFSDGVTIEDIQGNTVTRQDVPGGEIDFTITDRQGSSQDGSAIVEEAEAIMISSINLLHDTEEQGCSGSINLSITGGAGRYEVEWNSPNTGHQIINLCEVSDGYIPTITDRRGCQKVFDPILINTFTVQGETTGVSCPEDEDGGVNLTISGGDRPYVYEWLNDMGEVVSDVQDPDDLTSGTYTLKISEASGNTLSKVFIVDSESNLGMDVQVLSDFNGFGVSCSGGSDGVLRAIGLNSDGNFMYEWTRDNVLQGTDANLTNAGEGIYTATVTDGMGCMVTGTVELMAPSLLAIEPTITDVSCPGGRDGDIRIRVTGGVPGVSYTYQWDDVNASTDARLRRLEAGQYSVTATDNNGCTVTDTHTVGTPDSLTIRLESEAATERNAQGCNGAITANVSGGTAPYFYAWTQEPGETGPTLNNACPGEFILDVTDSNGCELQAIGGIENRLFPCLEDRKVISPDGDGLNDTFVLFCSGDLIDNNIEIYNRWGQLVYETENYDCSDLGGTCWEGETNAGEKLPEGPYYYVLEYTDLEGQLVQKKGSISLLRE